MGPRPQSTSLLTGPDRGASFAESQRPPGPDLPALRGRHLPPPRRSARRSVVIRLALSISSLLAFALVVPAAAAVAPARPLVGCTPVIDTQPENATGGVGGSISLSVEASGPPPLSYLWYFSD